MLTPNKYIARKLYVITLLVPLHSLTAGENRCQCQYKATDNIQMTSRGPINFCGQPSLYPVPVNLRSTLFLRSADLDYWPKGSVAHLWHIQLWAIAVCKLLLQPKVAIVTTSIRPVIIEDIVQHECVVLIFFRENWWNQHSRERRLTQTGRAWWSTIKLYQVQRGLLIHWHRFLKAVRQNSGTSRLILYNWWVKSILTLWCFPVWIPPLCWINIKTYHLSWSATGQFLRSVSI